MARQRPICAMAQRSKSKGTLDNGGVVRSGESRPQQHQYTPDWQRRYAFEATGNVTDFAACCLSFRVGGVLIDASAATFVDGYGE